MSWQESVTVSPQFSARSLARMLWKNKWYAVITWGVVTVIGALVVYRLRPVYRAETLVLVESQKIPENMVVTTVQAEVQDRLATINQQILSSSRLQKIIESFDLFSKERQTLTPEEIVDMMRERINVKLEKGWTRDRTGAFRIAFQAPDPTMAAEVANRIASLYMEENARTREALAEGTTDFLGTQLEQAKKRLEDQEAKISQYKVSHPGELPLQENSPISVLAQLKLQLQTTQDAINRTEQNKLLLENALTSAEASTAALSQMAEQAVAADAENSAPSADPLRAAPQPKQNLQTLESDLEQARLRYTDSYPEVRRLESEVAELRRLEQAKKKETAASEASLAPSKKPALPKNRPELVEAIFREKERVASVKTQLKLAAREMQIREAEQKELMTKIALAQSRIEKLPIREQELAVLTRDLETSKINYQALLDKKLGAQMSTEMERRQKAERFTVLDPARPPEKPFKPNRLLLAAVACASGLLLGVAVAIGKELKADTLLGEWELPPDVYVLGRIVRFDAALRGQAVVKDPRLRYSHAALVSSALLSLLMIVMAALLYFARHRW